MNDPFLQHLAYAAESRQKDGRTLEIEMILNVGGVIICGILISEAEFRAQAPKLLDAIAEISDDQEWKTALKKNLSLVEVSEMPQFIHIKRAIFRTPGVNGEPDDPSLMYWRGRIDKIDGFSIHDELWNGPKPIRTPLIDAINEMKKE